mgnify:CR=1 FL=1
MKNLGLWFGALLIVSILGLTIYFEIGRWEECRQTNSWYYCMKLMEAK